MLARYRRGSFGSNSCSKKSCDAVLITDSAPLIEGVTGQLQRIHRIFLRPLYSIVVIRRVPMLLQLNEILSHKEQTRGDPPAALRGLYYVIADPCHFGVFKSSGEETTMLLHRPLTYRLVYQKME